MARTIDGIMKQAVKDYFNPPTITRQTIVNANNAMMRKSPRTIRSLNLARARRLGVMVQQPQQQPTTTPLQTTQDLRLGAMIPRPTQPVLTNSNQVQTPTVQSGERVKIITFWDRVRNFFGKK